MGTILICICVLLGHFISAQSAITFQDATISQDFSGFFDNFMPFPFERNFDIPPYDTFFSSWRTWTPDFNMLSGFPPFMKAPRVQVFCDESKLTVLVDKKANGFKLNGEEIQLGDRCYSNRELPHQFVFTYDFDQCGTTQVMQNGFEVFSNSLHLNLKNTFPSWWQIPSTIYVSCIPTRSYYNPNSLVSTSRANEKSFRMKAMTSSWTSTADSNIYKRGQVVNLQVSAEMRPDEQLFIQSCFVSASPEPQTRPRHAVIMNKGCTSPLGSPHAVVQFVVSNKADVVNFILNTSNLISELYIHCSVLISDQGVTSGSKSCNYNVIQSRWEELSGDVAVCDCCKSKCKGLSVNNLPNGAKAIVSTGPFVIVDRDRRSSAPPVNEPKETSSNPASIPVRSNVPDVTEDVIAAGSSVSRSLPQGVVVVSQDPASRLTLWLPEELQDNEYETGSQSLTVELQPSADILDDDPKMQPSTTDQKSNLKQSTNEKEGENLNKASVSGLNLLTMVEGWPVPPQLDKTVSSEEFRRKKRLEASGKFGTKAAQVDLSLPAEISVNYLMVIEKPNPAEAENAAIAEESQRKRWFPAETVVNYLDQMRDELAEMQLDADVMTERGANDRPIIRSKLEFSKGSDGSQSLSYEEEVVKQQEETKRKPKHGLKGMRSTFLQLLRRMDKAE